MFRVEAPSVTASNEKGCDWETFADRTENQSETIEITEKDAKAIIIEYRAIGDSR
jgi:hypothetical protein